MQTPNPEVVWRTYFAVTRWQSIRLEIQNLHKRLRNCIGSFALYFFIFLHLPFFCDYPFSVPCTMLLVLYLPPGRAVASSGWARGRHLCHGSQPYRSKPHECIYTPLWWGDDCHLPDGAPSTFCANTWSFFQVHQVFSRAALSRVRANTLSRRPLGDILVGMWGGGTGKLFENLEDGVVQLRGGQQRCLITLW